MVETHWPKLKLSLTHFFLHRMWTLLRVWCLLGMHSGLNHTHLTLIPYVTIETRNTLSYQSLIKLLWTTNQITPWLMFNHLTFCSWFRLVTSFCWVSCVCGWTQCMSNQITVFLPYNAVTRWPPNSIHSGTEVMWYLSTNQIAALSFALLTMELLCVYRPIN